MVLASRLVLDIAVEAHHGGPVAYSSFYDDEVDEACP
jgi:hypothetical protein